MASGFDARVAVSAAESTYGTRVAPSRFIPLTAEDLGFEINRYFSPAIGTGPWGQPSIVTSKIGRGSLRGDVPSVGFGFLLNYLNNNTNTPILDSGTAYTTTFNLDTPPAKSFTVQVQNPPVTSSTLVPHDMTGCMMSGITFSWSAAGVLSYNIPIIYQQLDTAQSLVSYVAPSAYELMSFTGGSITVGGVLETNIIGDGSLTIEYPLRDDAYMLGSNGLIAKPVPNDKPTAGGTFTADFNDNTNLNRTLNNTSADVVMKFEGSTITGAHKYTTTVTLKDCVFTTNRATVDGPGPVQQTVSFRSAPSVTTNYPVIAYKSTGATL